MQRFLIIVGCVFLFFANATATTIDFEGLSDGTVLSDQFASLGVVFDNGYAHNNPLSSPYGMGIWVSSSINGQYDDEPNGAISGYFVNPANTSQTTTVDSVSAQIAYPDYTTTSYLEVFDINGNSLNTISMYGNSGTNTISAAETGIASFTFYWTNPQTLGLIYADDVVGIDNFAFELSNNNSNNGSNNVPEPSTMLLTFFGFLGITGLSRRKKRF